MLPCTELGKQGIFSVARGLDKVRLFVQNVSKRSVRICSVHIVLLAR